MQYSSEVSANNKYNPNFNTGTRNNKRPFKDFIKQVHKGERYTVPLSDVGGRVITVKSKESLILDSMDDWFSTKVCESDLVSCNKQLIEDIQLIPITISIIIDIPSELIYYKDYNWFSLLKVLNERAAQGGLSILVARTDFETAVRCSDALVQRVDTVLNRKANLYNVVKDVVKIKRYVVRNTGERCRLVS